MKDVIVFTSGPGAYAPLRIKEECGKNNLSCELLRYRNIDVGFKDRISLFYDGRPLEPARGVFIRGLGEDSIYDYLKLDLIKWYLGQGARVLNGDSFLTWPSLDKIVQHTYFVAENLPLVESYVFGSIASLKAWSSMNNYPYIIKNNAGSCGIGVYKINGRQEEEKLLLNFTNSTIKTMLVQRFLKSGEDLRVIVLGGEVLGAMKRIAKEGEYLTNYSRGGNVKYYDLKTDKKAVDLALRVANLFKLDYCGVDLMKDGEGNWTILEVNRGCQFEGFEKSTGINVARKKIDFLLH